MRRNNTQKLGDVLKEYVEALGMSRKLKEVRILSYWEEVLGRMVAQRTKKIFIRNGVLFVYLNSSVVRNELLLIKEDIIIKLNQKVGEQIITDVVLK